MFFKRLGFLPFFLLFCLALFVIPWVESQPRIRYEQIEVGYPQIKTVAAVANLPAAGSVGRLARVAADGKLYVDDGTSWAVVNPTAAAATWDIIGAMPGFITSSLPTPTLGLLRRVTDGGAAGSVLIGDGTNWNCLESFSLQVEIVTCPPYNAKGDGVTDDAAAIQAAIDAAEAGNLHVLVPPGTYLLGSSLTIDAIGLVFEGVSQTTGPTLRASHSSGPVVRAQERSVVVRNFVITSTDARRNGSAGNNYGIHIEGDDVNNYSMSHGKFERLTITRQPSHAFVLIGAVSGSTITQLRTNFNRGHGIVVEDGTITGRSNLDQPGILTFTNPEATHNGGYGIRIGRTHTTSATETAFRVIVLNAEISSNAWDPAIATEGDYQLVFHVENSTLFHSAISDASYNSTTMPNGEADTRTAKGSPGDGILIGGYINTVLNTRFLSLSRGIQVMDEATDGPTGILTVEGFRAFSSSLNPAIDIPESAYGVQFSARTRANITDLFTNAAYDSKLAVGTETSERFSARNLLINGGMTLAQEKTTWTDPSVGAPRVIDAWKSRRNAAAAGITITQQDAATATAKAMRVQRNSGNSATDEMFTWQIIESAMRRDVYSARNLGQAGGLRNAVSLRLALSKGANWSASEVLVQIRETAIEDDTSFSPSSGGSLRGTMTIDAADIPASPDFAYFNLEDIPLQVDDPSTLGVVIRWVPVGTAGANDWIEIGDAILTAGIQAMNFVVPDAQLELIRAQRFYSKSYEVATTPGTATTVGAYRVIVGDGADALSALTRIEFPVTMKNTPSLVRAWSTSGSPNQIRNVTQALDLNATVENIGPNGAYVRPTGTAEINTGDELLFHFDALTLF